jgi:acetylornithine deacetylase
MDSGSDGMAQHAQAIVDIRVPPQIELADLVSIIERVAEPPMRADLLLGTPPVLTDRTDPLVRAFARAIRGQTGAAPRMLSKKGSSDMNTLATTWRDVPMIAYGPGDASLDHTPHEELSAGEFRAAASVLGDAVRRWLADAPPAQSRAEQLDADLISTGVSR